MYVWGLISSKRCNLQGRRLDIPLTNQLAGRAESRNGTVAAVDGNA